MLSEREWDRLVELTMLEVEVQVLAAEATVESHAAEDAEVAYLVRAAPDSRLAHLEAEARRYAEADRSTPSDPDDDEYRQYCIELAAYSWRRDYDEWPTFTNLTDRLATDVGISHRVAARRILAAVNDPSDRAHLYAIRTARLAEILADEPTGLGPWQDGEVHDLRFYITAEAMRSLMETHYRNHCWRRAIA